MKKLQGWKLNNDHKSKLLFYGVAGLARYLAFKKISGAALESAKDAGEAVNPANRENIFARASSAVADILDNGREDGSNTFGGWIYGLTYRPEGKQK